MKGILNRLLKKRNKSSIETCEDFKLDQQQSDKLFGGFKEYKPPIYEHENQVSSHIKVTDLFHEAQ